MSGLRPNKIDKEPLPPGYSQEKEKMIPIVSIFVYIINNPEHKGLFGVVVSRANNSTKRNFLIVKILSRQDITTIDIDDIVFITEDKDNKFIRFRRNFQEAKGFYTLMNYQNSRVLGIEESVMKKALEKQKEEYENLDKKANYQVEYEEDTDYVQVVDENTPQFFFDNMNKFSRYNSLSDKKRKRTSSSKKSSSKKSSFTSREFEKYKALLEKTSDNFNVDYTIKTLQVEERREFLNIVKDLVKINELPEYSKVQIRQLGFYIHELFSKDKESTILLSNVKQYENRILYLLSIYFYVYFSKQSIKIPVNKSYFLGDIISYAYNFYENTYSSIFKKRNKPGEITREDFLQEFYSDLKERNSNLDMGLQIGTESEIEMKRKKEIEKIYSMKGYNLKRLRVEEKIESPAFSKRYKGSLNDLKSLPGNLEKNKSLVDKLSDRLHSLGDFTSVLDENKEGLSSQDRIILSKLEAVKKSIKTTKKSFMVRLPKKREGLNKPEKIEKYLSLIQEAGSKTDNSFIRQAVRLTSMNPALLTDNKISESFSKAIFNAPKGTPFENLDLSERFRLVGAINSIISDFIFYSKSFRVEPLSGSQENFFYKERLFENYIKGKEFLFLKIQTLQKSPKINERISRQIDIYKYIYENYENIVINSSLISLSREYQYIKFSKIVKNQDHLEAAEKAMSIKLSIMQRTIAQVIQEGKEELRNKKSKVSEYYRTSKRLEQYNINSDFLSVEKLAEEFSKLEIDELDKVIELFSKLDY